MSKLRIHELEAFGPLVMCLLLAALTACTKSGGALAGTPVSRTLTPDQQIEASSSATALSVPAECPVTLPDGNAPPGGRASDGWLGNGRMWTWVWPEGAGNIPRAGYSTVRDDGSIAVRFIWWADMNVHNVRGLAIEGRRLHGEAPPLEIESVFATDPPSIPRREPYQWRSQLVFPTEGCWEVTGTVGDTSLTSVLFVERPEETASTVGASHNCSVTLPNGNTAPGERPSSSMHGNGSVWIGLWPEGTVVFWPGGSGFIEPDGSLSMKFWTYWRNVGEPTITGRRLDAAAPPLHVGFFDGSPNTLPHGYRFESTALTFPTEGCWEVTARVGDEPPLIFVTLVVKV